MSPGMNFMAVLMQGFLDAIQPNDFSFSRTEEFLNALSDGDTVGALLRYEVGFAVCAVVAMLYMVSMPLIGGILACCRSCGKCGRGTFRKRTSRTDTYRRALYWSVVSATGLVLLGNTYMFMSNAAWGLDQINGTLNSLESYFAAVPEQFDHMMDESYRTVAEITGNLNTTGDTLGPKIRESLDRRVRKALGLVGIMANYSHKEAKDNLDSLEYILLLLDTQVAFFVGNVGSALTQIESIKTLKPDIHSSLTDFIEALLFDKEAFKFDYYDTFYTFQVLVDTVNWSALIQHGEGYLDSIPQNVTDDIKNVVQLLKDKLNDSKLHIPEVTRDLASVSTNMNETFQQLQRNIEMITPVVERAEGIWRAVGVVLCCLVLLVVGCNVLGLVLSPLVPDPKAVVIVRSPTAHYGGTFLLISAGVIFLFSWILMGAVLLLFVPGWSMYALVCKPWQDRELLQIIDTPHLIGFELGSMLGLKRNLTLTEVYTDCQKNMSLLSTLRLYDPINLDEISRYPDDILSNVTVTPITLLSDLARNQTNDISAVAKSIDYKEFMQHMNRADNIKSITEKKEDELRRLKEKYIKHELVAGYLDNAAGFLKDAISNLGKVKNLTEVNSTIHDLLSNMDKISGNISEVLSEVGIAQAFLNINATQIIKTENRAFVDRQLGNVTVKHAEWTNLTQKVARCGPVATAVDSAEEIICRNMVQSLNVFWFSLALCLIFFVPSAIFSIRLAKYYRRMEAPHRPIDDSLSEASTSGLSLNLLVNLHLDKQK